MKFNRNRAASALLPWALAALPGLAAASEGPLGDKCNPNQGFAPFAGDASLIHPDLTGIPLLPGHSVATKGTNPTESPELNGTTVFNQINSFSFLAGGTTIVGTYQELIQASTADGTCKQHTKLKLISGCISKVRFTQYFHPLDIVADFRDDLPGKMRSKRASRSNDGLTIEFTLKEPVCAGKTTRFLLLNTSINNMLPLNALELVAPDGTASSPLSIHVPSTLQ